MYLGLSNLYKLVLIAQKHDIHTQTIGKVTDNSKLCINDKVSLDKETMSQTYFNTLHNIMEK